MKRFYTKAISVQERKFLEFIKLEGWTVFGTKNIKERRQFKNWPNILVNLKRKGWIEQLEKGKYILTSVLSSEAVDSFLIGMKLVEPSSVAYGSALNHYGLTEQIQNVVYIQTTKRKTSRKILNVQYRFICVSSNKFFGLRKEWSGRNFYFITDLEKTILDCLDHPEYAGGFTETIKGFYLSHEKLDKEKLWQYAFQLGNNTVIKRIGYLSEILELPGFESFRANAQKILLPKYTVLDPMSPKIGVHLHRWRLLLNLKEEEIKAIARVQY